ncbi:MAG: thiamine-monophosphate kinase [Phycisphaeraceae bacterium]|nr:thiamine-monophosphate kinase [Phycisphaeraceae bacterium]
MREWDLLRWFFKSNSKLPDSVVLPPGDDMGGILLPGASIVGEPGMQVLLTVDQLADGVHFDLASHAAEGIGRKAITRNLSDVAAMAARPVACVAAASLPRNLDQNLARALFEAMRSTAAHYDCPLIGGDISMWDQRLVMSITVLAMPAENIEPVRRHRAVEGDRIVVTGVLGGSLEDCDGYIHHLDFEPRLDAAKSLAADLKARSMVDLSDGLGRDAAHLLPETAGDGHGLAIELSAADLPISPAAGRAARRSGKPAWWHALADGEDYELCAAVPDWDTGGLPAQVAGVPLRAIGRVVRREPGRPRIGLRHADGSLDDVEQLGWEHHP